MKLVSEPQALAVHKEEHIHKDLTSSSLQTASQLDSSEPGHVDIKYEDYPFTPTSMAPHNSWCALSQA